MIQVSQNGDAVQWVVTLTNKGPHKNTGVYVIDTLPAGIAIDNIHVSIGGFVRVGNIVTWTIGDHPALAIYSMIVDGHVTNITSAVTEGSDKVFNNAVEVHSVNDATKSFTQKIFVSTCPPAAAANDGTSCLCGDVSQTGTPCNQGVTTWKMVTDSGSNLDEDFELNPDGTFNAMGLIPNPFAAATFQFYPVCTIGATVYNMGPEATWVIPPQFPASFTDSIEINEDGTFTHTSLSGVVTNVDMVITIDPLESIASGIITGPASVPLAPETMKENYLIDDDSGAVTIFLPDPTDLGVPAGKIKILHFKRVSSGTWLGITLNANTIGLTTIDNANTFTFPSNDFTSITVFTDGVKYYKR